MRHDNNRLFQSDKGIITNFNKKADFENWKRWISSYLWKLWCNKHKKMNTGELKTSYFFEDSKKMNKMKKKFFVVQYLKPMKLSISKTLSLLKWIVVCVSIVCSVVEKNTSLDCNWHCKGLPFSATRYANAFKLSCIEPSLSLHLPFEVSIVYNLLCYCTCFCWLAKVSASDKTYILLFSKW